MAVMRGGKSLRDLNGVFRDLMHRNRTFHQPLAQGFALQQFRDNVGSRAFETYVINGEDVGMVQSRGGPRFLFKAPQMIRIVGGSRPNQLERNVASQPFVARAKNLAHSSGTDFFENPVVPHNLVSHSHNPSAPCHGMLGVMARGVNTACAPW
jgi:hypothetical protein